MPVYRTYTIAYRDDTTGGKWEKIVGFTGPDAREQALASYRGYQGRYAESDLALFFSWSQEDWRDGCIRYSEAHWAGKPITPALRNIVNARESDGL